jgi:tetratricopeptide (TPR) repeat protein
MGSRVHSENTHLTVYPCEYRMEAPAPIISLTRDYYFQDRPPDGPVYHFARTDDARELFRDDVPIKDTFDSHFLAQNAKSFRPRVLEVLEYLLERPGKPLNKNHFDNDARFKKFNYADVNEYVAKIRVLLRDGEPARIIINSPKGHVKFAVPVTDHPPVLPQPEGILVHDFQPVRLGTETPTSPDSSTLQLRLKTLEDFPRIELLRPGDILRLLDPQFRAIEFTARATEIKELWNWLRDDRPVSFRALVGPGGRGKTRLALHLLELLGTKTQRQWRAGFLDEKLSAELFYRWRGDQPTLIVIDDASQWVHELEKEVIPKVKDLQGNVPLRFLLIDRGADEANGWYKRLRTAARFLFPDEPVHLFEMDYQDEARHLEERTQLLDAALERLHQFTGKPKLAIDDVARGHLKSAEMGDPLVLFMAAIVGHQIGDLSSLSWRRIDLADYLADHEEQRIATLADPDFLPRHMAAYVCLSGGLRSEALQEACHEERKDVQPDSPWNAVELAEVIQKILPAEYHPKSSEAPPNPSDSAVLPIVPDFVCEVFLERVFQNPLRQPIDTIRRAFKRKPSAVMRTLIHMVQDFAPSETSSTLQRQQRALEWITHLVQDSLESLTELDLFEISSALPFETIALSELAASFYKNILEIPGIPDRLVAHALVELGRRQSQLGNDVEFLRLSTAAVEKYRQLADGEPQLHMEPFVSSVVSHVHALSKNGRPDAALETSVEAVELCRKLQDEQGGFLGSLSGALVNHASALKHLGRIDEALAAVGEAVSNYRKVLVIQDRYLFLNDFAAALRDQSSHQFSSGKFPAALQSADESLRLYVELARRNPDAYQPWLADAIYNHARIFRQCFPNSAATEETVRSLEDAVSIFRRLVSRNRNRFLPDLARVLLTFAVAIADVRGKEKQALDAMEEASGFYIELAQRNPQEYLARLAACQCLMAQRYSAIGWGNDAITSIQESERNCRTLSDRDRRQYLKLLSETLGHEAEILCKHGRAEDAVKPIEEAVSYEKELVRTNPGLHLGQLASTYAVWGTVLEALGEDAKAAEMFGESLRCIKPAAIRFPRVYTQLAQKVARSFMSSYVKAHDGSPDLRLVMPFLQVLPKGGDDESLQCVRESYRQSPREDLPNIARCYREQSNELGDVMLRLADEVEQRYAALPADDLASAITVMRERAYSLEITARAWIKRGFLKDAAALIKETVYFLRLLACEHQSEDWKTALASMLFMQGQLCHQVGQSEEALECIIESGERCRGLVDVDPDTFRPRLARCLRYEIQIKSELGRHVEAAAASLELVEVDRQSVSQS